MITVALIGADGSGKTTIGQRLQNEQPNRFKYIYMGVNAAASNIALPTTRILLKYKRARGKETNMGAPPDSTIPRTRPNGMVNQTIAGLKSSLRLTNLLAEEWFRQAVAWTYQRRGFIVLFDRHFFFDFYAYDLVDNDSDRPLIRRIHGFFLKHLFPKPDLVIMLDAPADILFARKDEGTLELVESRRQEYFQLGAEIEHFVIIDASQPLDDVMRKVGDTIQEFYKPESVRRSEISDVHIGQ